MLYLCWMEMMLFGLVLYILLGIIEYKGITIETKQVKETSLKEEVIGIETLRGELPLKSVKLYPADIRPGEADEFAIKKIMDDYFSIKEIKKQKKEEEKEEKVEEKDQQVQINEMKYKNIAKTNKPLQYWADADPRNSIPSPAEKMIIDILKQFPLKWYREVSFKGLQVNSWSYPRFDFLLQVPEAPGGIIMVEYDGQQWHSSPERKAMDKLKSSFCRKYGIVLVRFDKKDYFHLYERINTLLSEYSIYPRYQSN